MYNGRIHEAVWRTTTVLMSDLAASSQVDQCVARPMANTCVK